MNGLCQGQQLALAARKVQVVGEDASRRLLQPLPRGSAIIEGHVMYKAMPPPSGAQLMGPPLLHGGGGGRRARIRLRYGSSQ